MINIFVEGPDDENFVQNLLDYFQIPNKQYKIIPTGGWEKIKFLNNSLEQNKDQGGLNFIIFDADQDFVQRQKDIMKLIDDPTWVDNMFLFPNNSGSGCIETLLISITHPQHQNIHTCFDGYRLCVGGAGHHYSGPDDKAKIYTYLSCLGASAVVGKRNYTDANHWDLGHGSLTHFVDFLRAMFV